MKASLVTKLGQDNPISILMETPLPKLESNQVLVKVVAASINPFDYKVRNGAYQAYFPVDLPAILGGDVAGTVEDVGAEVTGFSKGDEVYGSANAAGSHGSFAEYTAVNAAQLSAKPKTIDFIESATLPLVAASAYQALVDVIGLKEGQKILIHGGAGGIGSVAIQIAHSIGAYVTATVSSNDLEYVKTIGADEAIDYRSEDFTETVKDYDAVFDTVGGETNKKSYQVLKAGGQLASMLDPEDEELSKKFNIKYHHISTKVTSERLNKIAELVDSGKLKAAVDKTFSLDQINEAFVQAESKHTRGKIVLTIND
ncbi:MAG: NADP-dependent oxidoreductase [Candidatus Saccharimonadales bacterium]